MLTIRADLMRTLEEHARSKFVGELRAALAKKYSYCLPSFPVAVQEQIVRNMLGRASRWGITWKSALVAFAEMMLAVAPNFDEHADVRAALSTETLDPNRAMLSINRLVSKAAWKEIAVNAQDLPLFVPARWIGSSLVEQTAAAIPVALGDVFGDADPRALAESAMMMAENLGLDRLADAGLALTARRLFYAAQLRERADLPWVSDIFDQNRSPREIVAMLKFRVSLDHRRFI